MKHTDFVPLQHKERADICLFYLPGWQSQDTSLEEQLREEFDDDIDEYDITPVPFENLPIDTMKELLSNMMEDANWHTRAGYEPELLAESMIQAGISDKLVRAAFMNMICRFETIIK